MDADITLAAAHFGEDLIEKILNYEPTEVISAILESGAPVWYQNATEGISPLHAAAFTQNVDLVNLLLENGAVWNAGLLNGLSLPFVAHWVSPFTQLTIAKILQET
jgi:protein arginine N-methyltransferase 2